MCSRTSASKRMNWPGSLEQNYQNKFDHLYTGNSDFRVCYYYTLSNGYKVPIRHHVHDYIVKHFPTTQKYIQVLKKNGYNFDIDQGELCEMHSRALSSGYNSISRSRSNTPTNMYSKSSLSPICTSSSSLPALRSMTPTSEYLDMDFANSLSSKKPNRIKWNKGDSILPEYPAEPRHINLTYEGRPKASDFDYKKIFKSILRKKLETKDQVTQTDKEALEEKDELFVEDDETINLKELFDTLDQNGDGRVCKEDLLVLLHLVGYDSRRLFLLEVIEFMETSGIVDIKFTELFRFYVMSQDPKVAKEYDIMKQIFETLDADQKGYITETDMKFIASERGNRLTYAQIRDILSETDSFHDGRITLDDLFYISLRLDLFV